MFTGMQHPFLRFMTAEVETGTDPAKVEPAEPVEVVEPVEDAPKEEPTPPWGDDFDPERAWKRIQAQKADLDAERAKRAQAVKDAEAAAAQKAREDAYREFGKQIGLVEENETPTVEGLTEALQAKDVTLTQSQAELQALRIENAILRHADKHGGDADALTDSESFKKELKGLDPTSDNYASEVERLVKESVEKNARFRKVQVAPSNSNGQQTPTGKPAPSTPDNSFEGLSKRRAERRKNRL